MNRDESAQRSPPHERIARAHGTPPCALPQAAEAVIIEYRIGDILQTNVEALVNAVNCVGIMGRGIALQFKERFPANFALVEQIRQRDIRSIALPALGSGLGGLDWSAVRARIEAALGTLHHVRVVVFEPHESLTPEPNRESIARRR